MMCHFLLQPQIRHRGKSPWHNSWNLMVATAYSLHLTQEAIANNPKTHWGRRTLFPRSKYSSACTLEQLVNVATYTIQLAKVMQCRNMIMAESPGLFTICLLGYLLSAECTGLFPFKRYIEYACLSDIEMSGAIFFTK